MKTTTSDLLKRLYDIAITNDPKQTCLITICRHLRELGYQDVEEPENAPGDLRFAKPTTGEMRILSEDEVTNLMIPHLPTSGSLSKAHKLVLHGEHLVTQETLDKLTYDKLTVGERRQLIIDTVVTVLHKRGIESTRVDISSADNRLIIGVPKNTPVIIRNTPKLSIPKGWVPCSPEWIKAGGNCGGAPRIWCEEEKNHYHPQVEPEKSTATEVPKDYKPGNYGDLTDPNTLQLTVKDTVIPHTGAIPLEERLAIARAFYQSMTLETRLNYEKAEDVLDSMGFPRYYGKLNNTHREVAAQLIAARVRNTAPNFVEPATGAPVDWARMQALVDRLNQSRSIDEDGAEFAVHTLDLSLATSLIGQMAEFLSSCDPKEILRRSKVEHFTPVSSLGRE